MLQDGLCYGSLGCCFATDEAAITVRIRFTGAVSGNNRRWPDKAGGHIRRFSSLQTQKSPSGRMGFFTCLMPGSSLLSHGETPHYHRRYGVSLLSSAWGQVGPPRYSRQANSVYQHTFRMSMSSVIKLNFVSLSPKHLRRCKVKPHGSLVSVSSTYRYAYTPDLSTSSSSTFLQDP